ncbi:histidine phosphatase family protein [Saccharomonospora azurea]|uniref:histidine phosphatase family protein n=1 Tax=Saccharomonospora azurea TaxID=40988 RepID=UPI0002400105|nr:histidine phosphatase family protein [Saccharomonospora azurea]EHK88112.1 fructose-2,6-bisphosphatase [Saccharomonospora azurea SZMC 14600]
MPEHHLFLLHHALTEWSAVGRFTGRGDPPLTAVGERQAHAAGRTYALMSDDVPALVLSSPRRATLRTAELAGLTVSDTTDELMEWDYGAYEGRTPDEVQGHTEGWAVWSHPVPGGETVDHVEHRADTLLDRVRRELDRHPVALVVPGDFGRVLIARWLELPTTAGRRFGLDAASLTVLGRANDDPRLLHLNLPPS